MARLLNGHALMRARKLAGQVLLPVGEADARQPLTRPLLRVRARERQE